MPASHEVRFTTGHVGSPATCGNPTAGWASSGDNALCFILSAFLSSIPIPMTFLLFHWQRGLWLSILLFLSSVSEPLPSVDVTTCHAELLSRLTLSPGVEASGTFETVTPCLLPETWARCLAWMPHCSCIAEPVTFAGSSVKQHVPNTGIYLNQIQGLGSTVCAEKAAVESQAFGSHWAL